LKLAPRVALNSAVSCVKIVVLLTLIKKLSSLKRQWVILPQVSGGLK